METEKISGYRKTQWAGRPIVFFDEIDSTNTAAKKLGEDGAAEGTLVVTECQTGGKGRRGRQWFSPPGTGVWMTLLLRPELKPEKTSAITLVAAVSVCRALREVTGLEISIKWPNDLVTGGKKICGILTEMSLDGERVRYAVVGIGINVNQEAFPEDLPHAWSLAMGAGHRFCRERIIGRAMECFEEDYGTYLQTGDMSGLKERYEGYLANLKRPVRVLAPSGQWEGVAEGIDNSGDLLVRDKTGEVRAVNSGEVSVRGIYDYV